MSPGRIAGMRRLEQTTLRLGGNGDNWHMTWAADDKQYVSLCDGQGWTDDRYPLFNSRMFAMSGYPPDVTFEHLPGYPDLKIDLESSIAGEETVITHASYYNFGTLAVDGRIYSYLSTFGPPSDALPFRFVGAKLIYSDDLGATWHNQDGSTPVVWEAPAARSRDTMVFYEESQDAFSLLTVLQMGRDYAANRDGYVYVYSPNGVTEGTMNELVMFRVPKRSVLDRGAYEFFGGARGDGTAIWTPQIDDRGVVCTFPRGWVNTGAHPYAWHPSVVYVPPLGVYLMANWGMGTGPDGMWFAKPSYLGFWVAERPWGPWEQVHEETSWTPDGDVHARAYQPQIAPKWIGMGGACFWLVWTDFQNAHDRLDTLDESSRRRALADDLGRPYYSFNVQKVEVTLK